MPKLRPPKEQPKPPEEFETKVEAEPVVESVTTAAPVELEVPEVVEPEQPQEDPSLALQKQLDELRKSEKIQREQAAQALRERDEAMRRSRERENEIAKFKKEAEQSQFDAISSAMAAASAEAEKAQQDIETAASIGDTKAQAEAYRRLARAEANLAKLEDGKVQIEEQRKQPPIEAVKVPDDPLEKSNLPELAKKWLREHPDYLRDTRKNAKIQSLHYDVLDEGHAAFSPEYFESLEQHLGLREAAPAERQEPTQVQQTQQRTSIVSAPVSREAPTSTPGQRPGQIRLTVAEREAAKMAGVTEAEYAKQKQRLQEMVANGTYGGRQ